MRLIFLAFSTVLLLNLCAVAQSPASHAITPAPTAKLEIRPLPPELLQRASALHALLQPSAKAWIDQQAKIEEKRPSFSVDELRSAIRQRFAASLSSAKSGKSGPATVLQSNNAVDGAAVMIILQMIQDGDKDLQAQMQNAYAMMQVKQALRNLLDQLDQEMAAGNVSPRNAPCTTPLCRSLPAKLSQLAAVSANTPRPIHLQAPANLTHQQLAMVQANVARELNNLNENIQAASETVQNSRGLASNQVQSDNQNANTMWSQIASILNALNEELEAPIHNML